MLTDREKARLRGLVRRTETRAKSLIHWQIEPFRHNEWIEEISVYDKEGKLLERYSPENQIMEQESIRHLFIYDDDGKLIEKQGYGEDNSAENTERYFYDAEGKMTESVYTNLQHFSKYHTYYDERENPKIMKMYVGKDDSLRSVQKWNSIYEKIGNKLEERHFEDEGNSSFVETNSHNKKQVTTFDNAGNKIKVERYLYDWLEEIEIYNDAEQKTEYKLFSKDDILAWHYIDTYDENGNLIASYTMDKSEVKNYLYEYDEWNNLIKCTEHRDDLLESEENHIYKYNSQRNWTKHVEIKSSKEGVQSTTEFERTISYF